MVTLLTLRTLRKRVKREEREGERSVGDGDAGYVKMSKKMRKKIGKYCAICDLQCVHSKLLILWVHNFHKLKEKKEARKARKALESGSKAQNSTSIAPETTKDQAKSMPVPKDLMAVEKKREGEEARGGRGEDAKSDVEGEVEVEVVSAPIATPLVEQMHVQAVYDNIADSWSGKEKNILLNMLLAEDSGGGGSVGTGKGRSRVSEQAVIGRGSTQTRPPLPLPPHKHRHSLQGMAESRGVHSKPT